MLQFVCLGTAFALCLLLFFVNLEAHRLVELTLELRVQGIVGHQAVLAWLQVKQLWCQPEVLVGVLMLEGLLRCLLQQAHLLLVCLSENHWNEKCVWDVHLFDLLEAGMSPTCRFVEVC